jgi:hypothetical protein
MYSKDLVARIKQRFSNSPIPAREVDLVMRIILYELGDASDFAQLADGRRLRDAIDFNAWLRELEAVVTLEVKEPGRGSRAVCPKCWHAHSSGIECGVDMGGGGVCVCKAEVVA